MIEQPLDMLIGYTDAGRKIHMAPRFRPETCDRTETVTRVLAVSPEGDKRADLIATMAKAKLPVSKLCGHCFPVVIRRAYAKARAGA